MLIPMEFDGIGRALYVYRSRELDHKWIIDNELSDGNVVLDLGANIGYYTIMEGMKIETGKIYAIEPDPRNIDVLRKNIKLNSIDNIVQLEQGAISNKEDKAEFILSSKTNLSSFEIKTKNKNLIQLKCKLMILEII